MRKIIVVPLLILLPFLAISQDSLDALLDQYNNESIPYISVKELSEIQSEVILLDAREINEYNTSHLQNAIYVGYDHFDINTVSNQNVNKKSKIVVYCSLGIRSEDISEKLKKVGYQNVYNLYGGIFEWKNANNKVTDSLGKETDKIHAFSKQWGKWLHKGKKVYTQ
ncbi:rhodanese-like domain-containing protein [uncultured Aquimarina sp.]|uniref:rhodanese-like domain-containing protein n=1 Tax=uncultured Aquimarina sp. TaxID=575652 RepID=UPI0026343915|nr:rhodanese-like domain-containing protein [uncultured Aquimarina sp.]